MTGPRGLLAAVSVGAALGALLAVAVTVLASPSAGRSTSTPAGATASAALNRARTVAMARHLVSAVSVPPGATSLAAAPAGLPGPMQTPASTSAIDVPRFWTVPMPLAYAQAWFAAHPPRGLRQVGSGQLSGSRLVESELMYDGPPGAAWSEAELVITFFGGGSATTTMRADGEGIWWDPTPLPDTGSGPRLRVTVAGGCPSSDRGYAGIANTGPGLSDALVPEGDVTGGLVCRYAGGNAQGRVAAFGLMSSGRLDARAATRQQLALRAVRLGSDGSLRSCPSDDGAAQIIVLSYRNRPAVDVWQRRGGCGGYTNGVIAA